VGYFKEGVGAINVLVRNNQITGSGIDAGIHAMRWAAIAVYGNSNAGVTAEPSNRYINIEGNSVVNAQQGCISVASGQLVNITGNVCKDTNLALHKSPSISVSYSNDVTVKGNQVSGMWAGGVEVDPATTKDVHVEAQ